MQKEFLMGAAKKGGNIKVILRSTISAHFFVRVRNPRKNPEKLAFRKYDPMKRCYALYKEEKLR